MVCVKVTLFTSIIFFKNLLTIYSLSSPKDYIQIKNADVIENIFKTLELPYVMGKVWTTDAIYRETRNLVEKRKSEGCIALCLTMWCVIIERWCLLWQQKQQM